MRRLRALTEWMVQALVVLAVAIGMVLQAHGQCRLMPDGSWSCTPSTPQIAGPLAPVVPPAGRYVNPPPYVVRITNAAGGSMSCGSGFLIYRNDQHGVVATCAHLFSESTGRLTVAFPDGQRLEGKVLAIDRLNDQALILIPKPDAAPAVVARDYPKVGERVTAGGYGGDERYRTITGAVKGYRSAELHAGGGSGRRINLEFAGVARQGDSGGPVFNCRGEVVAILWGTSGVYRCSLGVSTVALSELCQRTDRYWFPWNADLAKTREREQTERMRMQQEQPPATYSTTIDSEARATASEALAAANDAHKRLDAIGGLKEDIDGVKQEVGKLPGLVDGLEKGILGRVREHAREAVSGFVQQYGIWGVGGLGVAGWILYRLIKRDIQHYIASGGQDKLAIQHVASRTPWEWDDRVADRIAERTARRWGSDQGPLQESVAMAKEDLAAVVGTLRDLPSKVAAAVKGSQASGEQAK
jgi:hypothetical protein